MYRIFFILYCTNGAGADLNLQESISIDNSCRLLELEEKIKDYGKEKCRKSGWKFSKVDSVTISLRNGV